MPHVLKRDLSHKCFRYLHTRTSAGVQKKLYGKLKLETLMLNLMMMHLEERRREGKRRRRNVMSSE